MPQSRPARVPKKPGYLLTNCHLSPVETVPEGVDLLASVAWSMC